MSQPDSLQKRIRYHSSRNMHSTLNCNDQRFCSTYTDVASCMTLLYTPQDQKCQTMLIFDGII